MKKNIYILSIVCLLLSMACPALAQQAIHIKGVVLERVGDKDETLPGVSLKVVKPNGKSFQTVVDSNGNFSLDNVPIGSNLTFSCAGYQRVRRKVSDKDTNMKVFMEESVNQLNETVVIGYRKTKVTDVASAVTVVDTKDLPPAPVANVMEMLQGRVAGLNIQMNNGAPGSAGTYTIRGVSDVSVSKSGDQYILGSSTPLFVIDDIPQEDVGEFDSNGLLSGSGVSPISSLPYEDIATITVLKDAAATAQYGSKGAYGVILITTKRGFSKKPKIDFSTDMKLNIPPRLRDVLVGREERWQRIDQILQNDTSKWNGYYDINKNQALTDSLNPYYNNNTDWQGNFYRRTMNQSYNLAVSGGNTKFNYKINGNYYTENGILKNTSFDRYGLRTNMGYSPNNRLRLSISVNATLGKTGSGSGNALQQSGVASGASASSLLPPPSIYSASNDALGALMIKNDQTSLSYNASINMSYRLPWNIHWSVTAGYSYSNSEYEKFTPAILNNNLSSLYGSSTNSYRLYGRTSLSYSTKWWLLRFGVSVTGEVSSNKTTGNNITQSGLPNDNLWGPLGYSSSSGTAKSTVSDNTVSFNFAPSFGIINPLGGKDKYIITPTLRPELNSAYGRGAKLMINPGLSFRWNFDEEKFIKKLDWDWLTYGDIRTSWGRVVKYKASKYDVWGTYYLSSNTYNGATVTPIDFNKMPNNDMDPVTTTQWNLGFDLGLFNSRVTFQTDMYYKQVDNQISSVDLPDHNAFSYFPSTDVSIVNYGLEFGTTIRPMPNRSPWKMMLSFNFAINRDVMAKLPNEARQIINSSAQTVNRLGSNTMANYLYIYKGVYATDEDVPVDPVTGRRLRVGSVNGKTVSADNKEAYFKAGDPIWADLNGDYIIDEKDKAIVGNSQPRVTGGVALNISYKNFSFFSNCSFVMKRDIINAVLANNFKSYNNPATKSLSSGAALTPISAYNFWTPENTHADYPNPYDYNHANVIQPFRADQTLFMEDGSYFKVNAITLSYRFPSKWIKKFGIQNASVRMSMTNILTLSNYSGINPESVSSIGWDTSGGYPNSHTMSFGLSLGI